VVAVPRSRMVVGVPSWTHVVRPGDEHAQAIRVVPDAQFWLGIYVGACMTLCLVISIRPLRG